MSPSVIFLIIAIVVVGVLVFIAMMINGRGRQTLDREKYQTAWLKIENSLVKNNPATFNLSILEADKLFDQAMEEKGFGGDTMGNRLKNAGSSLKNRNAVWSAHKLRNAIAHEPDFRLSYENAKKALNNYKNGLKDLGAI